jgi:hypothetical protein
MIKKEETKNLFNNLRLFSIGLNGYLIEWSLITLEPKVTKYKYNNIDLLSKSGRMHLGCRFNIRQ